MDIVTRRLHELTSKARLQEYSEVLTRIIEDIYSSDCKLYFREDEDIRSSHSRLEDDCYIRVSLKKGVYKMKEHVIWVILHEFGHHFQNSMAEELTDREIRYEKEKNAWDFAERKFEEYKFSKDLMGNFIECRDMYLQTYLS